MPDRHGPLKTGRFKVTIGDVEVAGFQTVSIPGSTTTETTYREEEDGDHTRKLWGQTEYEDLEMERTVSPESTELWDWRKNVVEGKVEEGRKDVTVTLQNEEGVDKIRWEFTNAWPKQYTPPTLDASTEEEVAMEAVTLPFDEMAREEL